MGSCIHLGIRFGLGQEIEDVRAVEAQAAAGKALGHQTFLAHVAVQSGTGDPQEITGLGGGDQVVLNVGV